VEEKLMDPMEMPEKDGRRMDQAIMALMQHSTLEKAAATLDISDVTLWRWMKKEEFQEAYRKARREAFSQCVARLQNAASAAVSTLLRVMTDKDAPAASRVRAASCVLDNALKGMELEDIEARLQKLENLQQQTQGK
jgi:hypothetical protein